MSQRYFAYGSNMLHARMRARVPSAVPIGPARLPAFHLAWHKVSVDGSGKCDIVPAGGTEVWGVLYTIDPEHRAALDRAEGVGWGYEATTVTVELDAALVEAACYRALRTDASLRPYGWYKDFVVAGARQNGLPAQYIEALAAAPAIRDPDDERRRRNAVLLAGPAAGTSAAS